VAIQLQVAEFTGRYRRMLRRFTYANETSPPCSGRGHHDASRWLGYVTEQIHSDEWPRSDHRWPRRCDSCNYRFASTDAWQLNDCRVWRLPLTGEEIAGWGSHGRIFPPGVMCRAEWYDRPQDGRVDSYVVSLPDGGEWITTQEASGGGGWTVTGTPPLITVTPSIWHHPPDGWHGWITNGEFTDA